MPNGAFSWTAAQRQNAPGCLIHGPTAQRDKTPVESSRRGTGVQVGDSPTPCPGHMKSVLNVYHPGNRPVKTCAVVGICHATPGGVSWCVRENATHHDTHTAHTTLGNSVAQHRRRCRAHSIADDARRRRGRGRGRGRWRWRGCGGCAPTSLPPAQLVGRLHAG